MRNMITGLEITKREEDNSELSQVTGERINKSIDVDKESQVYDPLTGQYIEKSENDKSLWPSFLSSEDDIEKSGEVAFTCDVPFIKADKAKQIVYGIVYSPDEVDSQGDEASAEEIEKAAHDFLATCRVMKVMHKGKPAKVDVIESYIAPEDVTIGEQEVKKGSWVVAVKIHSKKIWKAVVDGELTGFSMAGRAAEESEAV